MYVHFYDASVFSLLCIVSSPRESLMGRAADSLLNSVLGHIGRPMMDKKEAYTRSNVEDKLTGSWRILHLLSHRLHPPLHV